MWHQVGRQSRRPDWVTFLTFCPQPPSCPQLIQLEQDHRLFQDPREGRIPEFHQNPLSVEAVAASLLCARSFVDLPVPEEVQLQHWCSQRGGGQVDWMKTSPRGGRWKESSCPHPSICHPHLQTDCCGPTPCTGANITNLNSATGQTLRCPPVSVNGTMMGRFHAFPDLLSISICTFSLTKAARWLASRDLYSVNKSQMLETAYGTCCLPMHRQQAECHSWSSVRATQHAALSSLLWPGPSTPPPVVMLRPRLVSFFSSLAKEMTFFLSSRTNWKQKWSQNYICADKCARLYCLM